MEETDCTKGKKIKYTYDVNGNIVTKMSYTIGNGTLSSDGFVGNQYNDTVWRDRATVINGQSVTYDASGNITAMGSKQYTWTNFRCLESYTNGYAPVTYTYNADGIRTSKTATVSGVPVKTEYTLVGDKITSQTNSGTTLYFCYDANGDVFGFIYNNQSYYYLKNLLGDVIKVLDSNGNEIVSYSYDTWGVCTASNNSIIGAINPFRYRSYYFDTDSGLYFLQSRYYDPSIGRFINSDDISYLGATGTVLSYNIFAYCENDAVNKVDPEGNYRKKVRCFNRDWIAIPLDIALSVLCPYATGVYDAVGSVLGSVFRKRGWKYASTYILSSVIPKARRMISSTYRFIANATKRTIGYSLAIGESWLTGKLLDYMARGLRINTASTAYFFITAFLSTGSLIAASLDLFTDGKMDGRITVIC